MALAPTRSPIQISHVTAHIALYDEAFLSRGVRQDAWTLFYVEAGALAAKVGGKDRVVESGHIVLYAPGEFYDLNAWGGPVTVLSVSFACDSRRLGIRKDKITAVPPDARFGLRKVLWTLKQPSVLSNDTKAIHSILEQVVFRIPFRDC